MMLVLQTADVTTRIWLTDGTYSVSVPDLEWESGRTLSEDLLGKLQEVLAAERKTFHDLSGIIIFSGPGSFTSLRIGHAVANTLAVSLKIPIIGTQGDDWIAEGLAQYKTTKVDQIAMPFYGAEAHTTKPKA